MRIVIVGIIVSLSGLSLGQERNVPDRFYEALPYWSEVLDVRDLILAWVPAPVPRTGPAPALFEKFWETIWFTQSHWPSNIRS